MNENLKKLVAALRSGKYKQGSGYLTRKVDDEELNCCLGVACKIYQEEVGDLSLVQMTNITAYDKRYTALPIKVQQWLDFKSPSGQYNGLYFCDSLMNDNDTGKTFEEIADIIERNYGSLCNGS